MEMDTFGWLIAWKSHKTASYHFGLQFEVQKNSIQCGDVIHCPQLVQLDANVELTNSRGQTMVKYNLAYTILLACKP